MEKNIKFVTVDSVRSFRLPRYNDIPDVGLYLEQTTKYINGLLIPIGFEITGSMIRNYVKMGLANNPEHKQYYANHIAHLIVIAILKNVISLDNISVLFSKQKGIYTDPIAYDYFCMELENMLCFQFGLKDSVDKVGVSVSNEKKMLRSAIIAISHITYLNSSFSEISFKQKEEE